MLNILFITDYVCPYCFVAKEALKKALAETGITADIMVQPMELSPDGKPQVDTYSDPERRSHYQILAEPARELGLDMKLPPHIIPRPRTRLAFEGRFFAALNGKEEDYNDLMYQAYFLEEQDIGDIDVLCELVKRIGLDAERYRKVLVNGAFSGDQAEENRISREQYKPSGVPTIYINDKQIELETYSPEEMKNILLSAEREDNLTAPAAPTGFMGCGPDGC